MKFRSNKPKPPVGMELSVTFSMSAELDAEGHRDAMLKFMEAVQRAGDETGAVWVRIWCAGIPEQFEEAIQRGLDAAEPKPALTLVVDNT